MSQNDTIDLKKLEQAWNKSPLTDNQKSLLKDLEELVDLTEWEQDFVASLRETTKELTPRQNTVLNEIYDRHFSVFNEE